MYIEDVSAIGFSVLYGTLFSILCTVTGL